MGKCSLSLFPIFFFSLCLSQFGLLSQVSSIRLPSGHSGPILTLSSAARTSLFSPHLLVADKSVWATSPLGVVVRPVICGVYLFFPPGYVALWDSKTPHRPASKRVSWCLETSKTPPPPHLGMGHRPYLFCLSFYLLYFVLPPFKDSWRPSCLSGCLVSSASLQKLFCGICSAFKWSFDEFVGEKVVSPSYSSILGLHPCLCFSTHCLGLL